MSSINVRVATPQDSPTLLEIYKPYVLNTAITFEYTVPTIEEFTNRVTSTLERYPYILAVQDDTIVGYAYASAFKGRKAYDWSVETSIYIRQGFHGRGYGKKLYQVLEGVLKEQNILNVNACITYADTESRYWTGESIRFHERMGYSMVGKFHQCGYKFNRWFDMVWLEKMLGEHTVPIDEIVPFSRLSKELISF